MHHHERRPDLIRHDMTLNENAVIHDGVIVRGVPAVKTLTPEVRERLTTLAAQLLEEQGVSALTLRALAERAGTSTMAVYTLFGDKRGLLTAVYEQGFIHLGTALQGELARHDGALEGLAAVGRAYRAAALASPRVYVLMFSEIDPEFRPGAEAAAVADAAFAPLVRAVSRCQAVRALVDLEPERIALHLWAVAHGMVSIELAGPAARSAVDPGHIYEESLIFAVTPFLAGA